jgi:7,8-dihydropterin-6-yl-methyl-4-(beta-D-ribofuranosyl)aminobenzene 5'-phosphate synthase
MKVTIIYDNLSLEKELKAHWGFSALVEVNNLKILFDTGANGDILLTNMKILNIDPKAIDEVFISHHHFDHLGGLSSFLNKNSDVDVFIPPSVHGVKKGRVIKLEKATELHPGIYSTGELEGIEQSLCVETEKGIVVIVGCSHPLMSNILDKALEFGKVYGIIGGLHGTPAEELKGLKLIVATHCTQYKEKIKELYPDVYVKGGVGKIIEIE